jgi:hypothetical protein
MPPDEFENDELARYSLKAWWSVLQANKFRPRKVKKRYIHIYILTYQKTNKIKNRIAFSCMKEHSAASQAVTRSGIPTS